VYSIKDSLLSPYQPSLSSLQGVFALRIAVLVQPDPVACATSRL
jgi:hypothetical protein